MIDHAQQPVTDAEREALLALSLTQGLGPRLIARLIEHFGSATAALETAGGRWDAITGISQKGAVRFRDLLGKAATTGDVQRELDLIDKHNATLIGIHEPSYPPLLKTIPDAPPLLWVRGKLLPSDALAVALVGSRKCTHYGREQAQNIACGLAQAGITIVSGGAYGIDIAAHRGALDAVSLDGAAPSRTIAVLGSGLAKPYPQDHTKDFARIAGDAGQCGAVISEFPMTAPPNPENFLRRNRVISGLSVGVLVIEAAKRSGALNTARRCVDEHGRELMALPGRVDSPASFGCNQIIQEQWGRMVTGVADILEIVSETGTLLDAAKEIAGASSKPIKRKMSAKVETVPPIPAAALANLSETEVAVLDALDEPRLLDEVIAKTGIPIEKLQAQLTMLEMRGVIDRKGGRFVRRGA